MITGGTARNIVPEWCTLEAEARSHDDGTLSELVQEILDAIAFAASTPSAPSRPGRARVPGLPLPRDDRAVAARARGARAGRDRGATALSGGAADANVFNERGLSCVNLANGMTDIHTPDERIAVDDLERMVDVTLALVDVAREAT